jgi:hypothetical protein
MLCEVFVKTDTPAGSLQKNVSSRQLHQCRFFRIPGERLLWGRKTGIFPGEGFVSLLLTGNMEYLTLVNQSRENFLP